MEAVIYVEAARAKAAGGATVDGGVWWWNGQRLRFVGHYGHQHARDLAEQAGVPLALWGEPYGYPGDPKRASRARIERCVREASERAGDHREG